MSATHHQRLGLLVAVRSLWLHFWRSLSRNCCAGASRLFLVDLTQRSGEACCLFQSCFRCGACFSEQGRSQTARSSRNGNYKVVQKGDEWSQCPEGTRSIFAAIWRAQCAAGVQVRVQHTCIQSKYTAVFNTTWCRKFVGISTHDQGVCMMVTRFQCLFSRLRGPFVKSLFFHSSSIWGCNDSMRECWTWGDGELVVVAVEEGSENHQGRQAKPRINTSPSWEAVGCLTFCSSLRSFCFLLFS